MSWITNNMVETENQYRVAFATKNYEFRDEWSTLNDILWRLCWADKIGLCWAEKIQMQEWLQ